MPISGKLRPALALPASLSALGLFALLMTPRAPLLAIESDLTLFVDGPRHDGRAAPSCDSGLPAQGLVVDQNGEAWVAGWVDWGASPAGLLAKFDAAGQAVAWTTVPYVRSSSYPWEGPRSSVTARPGGGAYFSTRFFADGTGHLLLFAFDDAFQERWSRKISDTESRSSLVLRANDTGAFLLAGGLSGQIPMVVQFDADGTEEWSHSWPPDRAFTELEVDAVGVAVVAGAWNELPVVEAWRKPGVQVWRWLPHLGDGASGRATALTHTGEDWLVAGTVCVDYPCSIWVARLDHGGRLVWLRIVAEASLQGLRPSAIAAGTTGEIFVAGLDSQPPVDSVGRLVKLASSGDLLWSVAAPLPGRAERFGSLAPQPDGGVLALGSSHASAALGNTTLLRYDAAGALAWSRRLDPPAGTTVACGLATGIDGSLRVASTVTQEWVLNRVASDLRVDSISPEGAPVWSALEPAEARPNESLGLTDSETARGAVAALPDGGFAATGERARLLTSRTRWLTRFRRDGTVVWSTELDDSPLSGGTRIELLADCGGALYLSSDAPSPGVGPFALARIGSGGDVDWTWSTPAGAERSDPPTWAVGPEGPIVAFVELGEGGYRSSLVWLSAAGAVLRSGQSVSVLPRHDRRLEVDGSGRVWIVGEMDQACFVEKWTAAGELAWFRRIPGPEYMTSTCVELEPDGEGGVVAVGDSGGRGLVVHLDAAGEPVWQTYSPPDPQQGGRLNSVDLGDDGEVQVGGFLGSTPDAPLLARFDREGGELWTLGGPSAGDGKLLWVVDRGPVGTLALFRAADGTYARLSSRLFDPSGGLLEESELGDLGMPLASSAVGRAVTADGAILVGTGTQRASYDVVLTRLRGVGDLFAADFEGGDLSEWADASGLAADEPAAPEGGDGQPD